MNKLVLALTTASLLALVACGGGGDEDAPVQVNQPTNQSAGGTGGGSGGSTGGGTNTSTIGNAVKFNKSGTEQSTKFQSTTSDLNVLVVDGVKLPVGAGTGISAGTFMILSGGNINGLKYNGGVFGGTAHAYSRYGLVKDTSDNVFIYYQGNPTSTMPTTGTAKYNGYSVAYKQADGKTYTGNAAFDVDFGNKTVSGTLSNFKATSGSSTIANVSLKANISGNSFSGKNGNVQTDGKFYGTNAAEMAGKFSDSTTKIQGAFGAKKQ